MKQGYDLERLLRMNKLDWAVFFILFISAILIIPYTVFGQNASTGRISGILLDAETGDPLIGANVHLEGTALEAGSDLDRFFLIENVTAGQFNIAEKKPACNHRALHFTPDLDFRFLLQNLKLN